MLDRIEAIAGRNTFLNAEIHFGDQGTNDLFFSVWPLPVTPEQIQELERQGCRAQNWASVKIAPGADLAKFRNVAFEGHCLVGNPTGPEMQVAPGVKVAPGIENIRLRDAIIGDGCCIRDVVLMARVDVMKNCVVMGCGIIAGGEPNCMGMDREIVFSPGSGGRQFPVIPGMTSDLLAGLATKMGDKKLQSEYRAVHAKWCRTHTRMTSLIGEGSVLTGVKRFLRSATGPHSRIEDASLVEDSVILSTREQPSVVGTGAVVRRSTANEGVEISTGASVENCHLCEASWAKGNALVSSSIIAPNSGVTGGECRTSFVGPFLAFHHQSLLIATFWPGGRGNVSYGANIGSNHSGKAPDQEHWAGEGVFYGLDTCIKFPCNTVDAAYTLVASGVTMLPQKVAFPFSLINTLPENCQYISPAYNEIHPGWMIENNMYGLLRNMSKFASRNNARTEQIETRAFRPDQLALIYDAWSRLRSPKGKEPEATLRSGEYFYTDKQVSGLGKNVMRESARIKGLTSYEFAMQLIIAHDVARGWRTQQPNGSAMFEDHELSALDPGLRSKLPNDFTKGATWAQALEEALPILEHALRLCRTNRTNDDNRGKRIIPDYTDVHGTAEKDEFILTLQRRLDDLRAALGRR